MKNRGEVGQGENTQGWKCSRVIGTEVIIAALTGR